MNDLIARLEVASEGNHELDQDIFFNLVWAGQGDGRAVPFYTRSLDAALSLVPDGWAVAEMKDEPGRMCAVRLWCPANRALGYRYPGHAPTPALALCIAALKARKPE